MRRSNWVFIAAGVGLLLLAAWLFQQSFGAVASDWAYDMSGIREAQSRGLDGSGVTVAIVDTGFEASHPSLSKINVVAWRDFINGRTAPYDDAGHGSHVAGIVAGSGSTFAGRVQGLNMRGAAPGIGLIAVKAISGDGTGTSTTVANGIDFAVTQGADVICLSLGGRSERVSLGDDIEDSVTRAINRGILVVAAAGNTGEDASRDDVETPATIADVIAVGAHDEDRRIPAFSAQGNEDLNYGVQGVGGRIPGTAIRQDPDKKPEIVAPGVKILSAWSGGDYRIADGTSQAAPFVCGALALLLQAQPSLDNDNSAGMVGRVKAALQESAEPVPDQRLPHDPRAGYGMLRADRLLDSV